MPYSIENARSLLAIILILFVCWLLSENKRVFPWRLAIGAIVFQTALILLLFALPNSRAALSAVTGVVTGLADATDRGVEFVFGYLGGRPSAQPFPVESEGALFIFGFRVLPLILVISALSALLWHWRILRWLTRLFGLIFEKTMGLGGASALAVAANIFMGMVESPIVIRAYLDKLTRAELYLLMVVGLSTVAGSTMVAYALILAPVLENAAGHVLAASIISAPAGVLLARIIIPLDREKGVAYDYQSGLKYQSSMDAATTGIRDGVMVAVNVASFLIVFVAFVWMINALLGTAQVTLIDAGMLSPPADGQMLTLQNMFGYVFAPVVYMIGVSWQDALPAGEVLGVKLFLTEFIAFINLSAIPDDVISDRSRMIMTYALCGFANVASMGIMSGGLTALMPDRRAEILSLVWRALPPGFMATLVSASLVAALPEALFR